MSAADFPMRLPDSIRKQMLAAEQERARMELPLDGRSYAPVEAATDDLPEGCRRVEWPIGSGDFAVYDRAERTLWLGIIRQAETGEITHEVMTNQLTWLHNIKMEFGVDICESPAPDLFAAAKAGMDEGLARVDGAADEQWKAAALAALEKTCRAREEFISDDVWEIGQLASTREDRALGPVFQQAKKHGWCVRTDRVQPSVRSHLSGKPVWRSLIFAGTSA